MSFKTIVSHGLLHAAGTALGAATRPIEYKANAISPTVIPNAEDILDLARKGWIAESVAETFAAYHGVHLNVTGQNPLSVAGEEKQQLEHVWNQSYWAGMELPTVAESYTLTNRQLLSPAGLDQMLQRRGFFSKTIRADMASLRFEIPGSSDLVRFSVRHVFEPDLIAHLGYNDEFRPILDMWHRFQGLNYPLFSGPFAKQVTAFERERGLPEGSFLESYAVAGLPDPTWAQAYWWSHWVLPSPTQGYEMFFRLRPDRNRAFDPPFARELSFGLEDLNLLLRANDYPPFYRAALAAIAHRVPGIRFLRQLRSTGVFGMDDVIELLLRQGYSRGDATVLAQSVERADRDAKRKTIEQQAKGQIAKYWELGIISKDDYVTMLVQHGLTEQDARDAVDLGELDLRSKRVAKILAFAKKQFTSGAKTNLQTRQILNDAGIQEPRLSEYLTDWAMELHVRHKEIEASKAVKWACDGLITVAELTIRLANLQYQQQDVAGLIAEASLCSSTRAARAAAQAARAEKQRISELKAAQRAAAQAIQAARRQLSSHGTPSQLRKWYCEGHLGTAELYSRLQFLGWPDADIQRLISDCKGSTNGQPAKPGA